MKINGISFKAYEPYPVGGGKVEKLKYETEQGWRLPTDTFEPSSSHESSAEKPIKPEKGYDEEYSRIVDYDWWDDDWGDGDF